ncbi:MAG: hypothetical protein L0H53_15080 [Candidatus Nitrosocosmicus sp.]|nr:hypothetical protein [Candidatus Nitrosocosmicus sp.]MDN5868499.1 hypothetical protein [Candidatus Nitrosocosmicus sp.]
MEKEVELVKLVIDFHNSRLANNKNASIIKHDKLQDIQLVKGSSDK